jgi:hypothetical protein
MKIVTIITDKTQVGYVHALKASCKYYKLELVTLEVASYTSHRQKTRYLREYLETVDPDELIFFSDGYDVIFVAGEDEILKKYKRLSPDGKMLMSADRFIEPEYLIPQTFKKTNHGYDYFCAGGFISTASVLKINIDKVFEVMKSDNSPENKKFIGCDQYEWSKAIEAKKVDIVLDHNCEIFQTFTSAKSIQNLYEFVNNESPLSEDEDLYARKSVVNTIKAILDEVDITGDGRVYNKSTKTYPVQIHYNTKINKLVMFMEPFVQIVNRVN